MKYAKIIHKEMLPYFKDYKEASDELKAAEQPLYFKSGEALSESEKKYREYQHAAELEKAKQKHKEAKNNLFEASQKVPAELRAKFAAEIEADFAFKPEDVDDKVVTLLNSTACRPFDLVTMYRATRSTTNKRLIAAKLQEYTDAHRKEMSPVDIEASAVVLAEVRSHSADIQLQNFDSVVNAYNQFIGSDTVCRAYPQWAESVGLEM